MDSMGLPGADWVTKLVTVGPPCLLVIGLLIILQAAARNKIDVQRTAILSGIVAVFFGLWILALPELRTRRVEIVTTIPPNEFLRSYSLSPVKYRFDLGKEAQDNDLDNGDFPFPNNADTLRIRFNLENLLQSYEDNLDTIINVAQRDPDCFRIATQGHSYSQVAAKIKQLCPGTLVLAAAEARQ